VCSALKQKSITRAECDWDVAALEDKGKNYVPIDAELQRKLSEDTMIIQRQDIQGNFKHLMRSKNTTGGQDFEFSSRTMSKDVEYVNNSKSTEIQQNQCSCL
jgi:hypothetical protein